MTPSPEDSLPDDPSERTFAQMQRRVGKVRTTKQMFAALRWSADELDRTFTETPASVRQKVACRSGCDFCCSVPVDVQAHEVFFAAEHIQLHFSAAALEDLIARLTTHRARSARYTSRQRDRSRHPCALLSAEGACTIYGARPQPCRAHHASDAAVCRAHAKDAKVDLAQVYIPPLRARLFAVMLSVDAALEFAGYDDRAYDFGSALHEALTNSLCLAAWMRHETAFPDDCLADRDA